MDDTHRIVFGPESGEYDDVLRLLCERSLAVTMILRDGTSFGCLLVALADGVLIYERWDDATGLPSGDAGTVAIGDVAEIRVY